MMFLFGALDSASIYDDGMPVYCLGNVTDVLSCYQYLTISHQSVPMSQQFVLYILGADVSLITVNMLSI
jgi:hypothetical protein